MLLWCARDCEAWDRLACSPLSCICAGEIMQQKSMQLLLARHRCVYIAERLCTALQHITAPAAATAVVAAGWQLSYLG